MLNFHQYNFQESLHWVVGGRPRHIAEGGWLMARSGCVWHGPVASKKVRELKATSIQHLRYLSFFCWFLSQVHKRWLRFLPFWASASSVGPRFPVQSAQSSPSPSAAPAAPHRACLPGTNVWGRLQLCPLQQFCPIIPSHAQIHERPSSPLKQADATCSGAGRARRV